MAIIVDEEYTPTQTDLEVNASVPKPYTGYGSIGDNPGGTGVGDTSKPKPPAFLYDYDSDDDSTPRVPVAPEDAEETEEGTEEGTEESGYVNPFANYPKAAEPSVGGTPGGGVGVTEAPAYEQSEAEKAWAEMYGTKEKEILDKGGLGIPEETQALMKQQQFDLIEADKEEKLRNLRNSMETRGITNSFLLFSEESKIKATATRALAESVTNIQIQSALMKISSYENALGRAANFLGYLSNQSQLAYAPKMATWNMKQQAKIVEYQAKMDIYKMKLNQCYTQNNMYLAAQIQSELDNDQFERDKYLAQMEIDAARENAAAAGQGAVTGQVIGGIFALAAACL
jgi:hypothetical protein